MWLSRKLSQHEMQDVASAQDGTVTVEGGELAVFSSGEKREVKTAAPGGYEWQPKKGESRATAAKQYVAEALADEEGLSVTGRELAEKNGFLELRVLLRYENETGEAVVTIGGE